jgi:hypothetical protein
MKQRIRIRGSKGEKDIVKEFEIPNLMHFQAQLTYKHQVQEVKKKRIARKAKHKKTRPEHFDD